MTSRRAFLAGSAAVAAVAAMPATTSLASNPDAELLGAVAEFWHHYNHDPDDAPVENTHRPSFRVAALPALTLAGILAKYEIAMECVEGGEAIWDEALFKGLHRDIKRMTKDAEL